MKRPAKRKASISDVDRKILSLCESRWQKVARIAGQMGQAFERQGLPMAGFATLFDARIAALVRNGRLEAKGNIREWRHSEVRLSAERRTAVG
jgi:hypothetical protein